MCSKFNLTHVRKLRLKPYIKGLERLYQDILLKTDPNP